jgi:CDP-diacylglycerol--glycerol-3-phosphate 3-phosphatidyltransferase
MHRNELITETRPTFTETTRARFQGVLVPISAFLNRLKIAPNTMTLFGLAGNLIGALFLARGQFLIGGLVVIAMGPIDALDGTMARLRGEPTDFGAFVDSVVDRYSELIIFAGILVYYAMKNDAMVVALTFMAAFGSMMVSYVRARAQGLGFEAKIGILTRMERFLILAPSLVLSIPWLGVGIIAVFAHITAIQRILSVRKQARYREK